MPKELQDIPVNLATFEINTGGEEQDRSRSTASVHRIVRRVLGFRVQAPSGNPGNVLSIRGNRFRQQIDRAFDEAKHICHHRAAHRQINFGATQFGQSPA